MQFFANMSISSLDIIGSFSCSIQDHIKLQRMKGSLSVQILSQAPSREFSSFFRGKKKGGGGEEGENESSIYFYWHSL